METRDETDFAGEVQTEQHSRPRWLRILPYILVLWGLWYFLSTAGGGGLNGPNRIFLAVLVFWLIYTPIAKRLGWFVISL